jgi:hypothetical protein
MRSVTAAVALTAAMFVQVRNVAASGCEIYCEDLCIDVCSERAGCADVTAQEVGNTCQCSGTCQDGTRWS